MRVIYALSILSYTLKALANPLAKLPEALRAAAGVYKHPRSRSLKKTVLVTASNFGYLNHLMNFKCFADRLNLKFLVFAFDDRIYSFLEPRTDLNVVKFTHGTKVGSEATYYRSKDFNIMSNRKFEATLEVLKLGYDLIFADPDVVIIDDPVPHVIYPGIDYAHSINKFCPL